MAKRRTDGSVDYLSSMPEPIIHHILSFLSAKDLIGTSVLSKTWKVVVDSHPILEFDLAKYMGFHRRPDLLMAEADSSPEILTEVQDILKKFEDCVDEYLFRYSTSELNLQKLSLIFDIPGFDRACLVIDDSKVVKSRFAFILEKWVRLAIENDVKEFSLSLMFDSFSEFYCLPKTILGLKSLTVLTLDCCILKLEDSCSMMFPSLLKLSLERVYVQSDNISEFISGCPLIEDIFISDCWGMSRLHIFGLRKLKKVILDSNCIYSNGVSCVAHRVEVESPCIDIFNFILHVPKPSIVKVDAKCLKRVVVDGFWVLEELLGHLISLFSILESLKIVNCHFETEEKVKVSSWSLKIFEIGDCSNLVDIEIDAPNLLVFKYIGCCKSVPKINAQSYQRQIQYKCVHIRYLASNP